MARQRRPAFSRGPVLLALCGLLAAPRAFGQDDAEQARALLAQGQASQAIPLLKAEIERQPLDKSLRLWLARAYLDDGNHFWALRTIAAVAAIHPEDCNLTLWQAHIQLKQNALEQARDLLQAPCSTWPPTMARRSLLLALVEQGAGATTDARAHLGEARAAPSAFPEDREAIAWLEPQLDPGVVAPFSGRLELAMGGTTNARAGSPVDPASQGNSARSLAISALGSMRFVTPNRSFARLSAEAEIRGIDYPAEAGRDFSYLMFSGRPGLLLTGWNRRLLLGYRYESFLLAGGDRVDTTGPLWFFEAHRGEWELELTPALTFFGGAGWRGFREMNRTRTEIDGGIGGGWPLGGSVHLMAALSGRYHEAKNDAYDQRGVSLLISAEHRWARRWSARAGLLASSDTYPHSAAYAGFFDSDAPAVNRRDRVLRLSLSSFAPPLRNHLKLGVTYEFAVRDSTAPAYEYTDHRVLAKLIWTFTADPWLPHAAKPQGHVPMNHGLGATEVAERIQDLLRQSEAAQRSSSCRE